MCIVLVIFKLWMKRHRNFRSSEIGLIVQIFAPNECALHKFAFIRDYVCTLSCLAFTITIPRKWHDCDYMFIRTSLLEMVHNIMDIFTLRTVALSTGEEGRNCAWICIPRMNRVSPNTCPQLQTTCIICLYSFRFQKRNDFFAPSPPLPSPGHKYEWVYVLICGHLRDANLFAANVCLVTTSVSSHMPKKFTFCLFPF